MRVSILGIPLLAIMMACGRPSVPDASGSAQQLPFDRQPSAAGVSPTQSFVPSGRQIPEGTYVTIRLMKPLSSATAHTGDSFEGSLDVPIIVDDQTLVPHGALVSGRVLDAKRSTGPRNPGYLRITLVSFNANGRTVPVDTSSIFSKATSRDDHSSVSGTATDRPPAGTGGLTVASNDVQFTPDRHLTFRLAEGIELNEAKPGP
jgi:hypothetical protein